MKCKDTTFFKGCWKETRAGQTYYACVVAPFLFLIVMIMLYSYTFVIKVASAFVIKFQNLQLVVQGVFDLKNGANPLVAVKVVFTSKLQGNESD
ncbi:hypothetical protein FRX31_030796 [Thalictrum thalictroides]|uniref:Uncharacterized protein n=1 Tax=Thalictrum thalictroides TaxID=46969 RepID=A0A7J6V4A2_THATH|nr:hypothetical protein FRX31_030796 [Thalictrum thalictroides]